jgi:ubiquinone/menaquinone biosynthesis C-methylase UbiE
VTAAFDALAERYDELWTHTAVGRLQRQAVWQDIDPLFRRGDSVLDVGCGTGEDALHLMAAGVVVRGIDASPAMVEIARTRGVNASVLPMEELGTLAGPFDAAISNFGALNCVPRLGPVAEALGRLIRPQGRLALCLLGQCCAWEICHHLRRGRAGKAFRRWRSRGCHSSFGAQVYYPSVRRLVTAFRRYFRLDRWCGVGLFVPPSYVALTAPTVARLAFLDRRLAGLPMLRGMADHRLLIFTRV